MWFLIFRFLKRSPLFKLMLILSLAVIVLVVVLAFFVSQSTIMSLVLEQQSKKLFKVPDKSTVVNVTKPSYDPTIGSGPSTNGKRGNGLNLLLIDSIQTEGYVKELLSLYRDSAEGKLTPYQYHLPVSGILGVHANETRYYSGASNFYLGQPVIPKSYIPFDASTGTIYWNKKYGSYPFPAEALTLKMLNENVINIAPPIPKGQGSVYPYNDSNKLDYTTNGINHLTSAGTVVGDPPTRDVNVFQISRNNFYNTSYSTYLSPSKLNGYNSETGRKTDAHYVPDQLSYLDSAYTNLISTYDLDSESEQVKAAEYSIYHNGGPGIVSTNPVFGVPSQSGKIKLYPSSKSNDEVSNNIRNEYKKNFTVLVKELLEATNRNFAKMSDADSKAVAMLLMFEQGYYITQDAFNYMTSDYLSGQIKSAWSSLYGEDLTIAQIRSKVRERVRTLSGAYPEYFADGVASSIYGLTDSVQSNPYGYMFKLYDETSDVYLNKLGDKDPRVFRFINVITAGHAFDSIYTGPKLYGRLLKYSGVGIDPTNPTTYMQQFEDEFQPGKPSFDALLKKISAPEMPLLVKEMLEWAYNHSGFYYYLGGQALQVSSKNFTAHQMFINSLGNNPKYFHEIIYKTKSGVQATKDTPDEDLVNFGEWLYDCSSYIADAYNSVVVRKLGGKLLPALAASIKKDSLLTDVSDVRDIRPGDIFVSDGHAFFFLAYNTSGSTVTIGPELNKVSGNETAMSGGMWVLEAPTQGRRVGLHARMGAEDQKYVLRRFNAFRD